MPGARRAWRIGSALCLAALAVSPSSGAIVEFVQNSIDDATHLPVPLVNSTQWVETAVMYTTVKAPAPLSQYSTYRFTYWSNSSQPGEPYRDPWGRSLNPISFTIYEDTTATAHYLPAKRNTDADGIPDWFEIEYFGTLTNAAAFDSDGDGITLQQEYTGGTHPLYANTNQAGGVAYAESALVTCNLAGYPSYLLRSVPTGTVDQAAVVLPGTVVTSPNMTQAAFGYWTLDGERQADAWGVAVPQITFVVRDADREGVAYLFAGDEDGDGVPDAWEQYYFGTTDNAADSDTDGDGRTLLAEYTAGCSPVFGNAYQEGGVVYADSAMVTVNLADFSRYVIRSEPAGTINLSGIVPDGTAVTTTQLNQTAFGYWTVDGVRQQDAWGVALRQASFVVDGSDREAVAYFFDGDSDGDGIPDAWEMYYLSSTGRGAGDDSDGDGITLLQEYQRGSSPVFANVFQPGGVSWADSSLVVVNEQLFERWLGVQVDGVLKPLFSFNPSAPGGHDFGSQSAPVPGDWDGDGDLDLMVFCSGGVVVYENGGTRATMNYSARTSVFGPLKAAVAGNSAPVGALGDWTGDGNADLVVGGATDTLTFFISTGGFTNPPVAAGFQIVTGSARSIPALGDLNGDGLLDLLILLADGSTRLYLHNGNAAAPFGTFTTNALGVPVPSPTGAGIADVNRDGTMDVLVSDDDGRIWDFRGVPGGGFTLKSKVWAGTGEGFAQDLTIGIADLDGDGDIDAFVGSAAGALVYLRDPRIGRPMDLHAAPGPDSVMLSWAAESQSRLRGYQVYRAVADPAVWSPLLAEPVRLPAYRDEVVTPGVPYYYRVTALSYAYLPGNSTPKIMETDPSDVATARAGTVKLSIRRTRGQPANYVRIPVSLENSMGLRGAGMEIAIAYDPAVLTPATQVNESKETVLRTGLSAGVQIADNGATANGTLTISGLSGQFKPGEGKILTLVFKVNDSAAVGLKTTIGIASATFYSVDGIEQVVDIAGSEYVEVGYDYVPGDVDGDGSVTEADEHRLKELVRNHGRGATDDELQAGDLNGDGRLTQQDLVLLKRLLQGLPLDEGN